MLKEAGENLSMGRSPVVFGTNSKTIGHFSPPKLTWPLPNFGQVKRIRLLH